MKLLLNENISKYRKNNKMTQEDLAEALGVTFAAVSKWERGLATPDLELIVQMANIFDVSVDALIGHQIKSSNIDELIKKTDYLVLDNKNDEAIFECNNALIKYPNNFKVVYFAAKTYQIIGYKLHNNDYLRKSIDLMDKSILLISQNDNTEISEITIKGEIAQCYISLGETDKGIEIMKKYNINGIYSPYIAFSYAIKPDFKPSDIEQYLISSISNFNSLFLTAISYSKYYEAKKNYSEAINMILWLKNLLIDIKQDKNKTNYYDKLMATGYAICANLAAKDNDYNKAYDYLLNAYKYAISYDKNPTKLYFENVIFSLPGCEDEYAEDTLGNTALEAIEKRIENNKLLKNKLNELKKEDLK